VLQPVDLSPERFPRQPDHEPHGEQQRHRAGCPPENEIRTEKFHGNPLQPGAGPPGTSSGAASAPTSPAAPSVDGSFSSATACGLCCCDGGLGGGYSRPLACGVFGTLREPFGRRRGSASYMRDF